MAAFPLDLSKIKNANVQEQPSQAAEVHNAPSHHLPLVQAPAYQRMSRRITNRQRPSREAQRERMIAFQSDYIKRTYRHILEQPSKDAEVSNAPSPPMQAQAYQQRYKADNVYGGSHAGYSHSTNNGSQAGCAHSASNGSHRGHAHSSNNGVAKNIKYGATTYLPLVDSSIVSLVPPPNFPRNFLPGIDSSIVSIMSLVPPPNFLPGIDSSIVSMVPPASFLNGIGCLVIPTIASNHNNNNKAEFSERETYHSIPATKQQKPAEEKREDIMLYANGLCCDTYVKKIVGEGEVTFDEAVTQSRYLSRMLEYAKVVREMEVEVSDEEEYHVVKSVLDNVLDGLTLQSVLDSLESGSKDSEPEEAPTPDMSKAEEALNSIQETPTSVTEDAKESLDSDTSKPAITFCLKPEKTSDAKDAKETTNSNTSKSARQLPLCLRPFAAAADATFKLCAYYRAASIEALKMYLTNRRKFNEICSCCGESPVHLAVRRRSEPLLQLLASSEAKLDATNFSGQTPLYVACQEKLSRLAAYLLDHGADPLKKTTKGETCLSMCQATGNLKVAKLILLKIKAASNQQFFDSHLRTAARDGSKDFVELYLRFGASIDHLDEDGNSAISLAVEKGHEDVLACLLKRSPDLERSYKSEGNTLLHLACKMNRAGCVQQLLFAGASVHSVNRKLQRPLHVAAQYSSLKILQMLVDCGADIEAEDISMHTALCCAIIHVKEVALKYLLSEGASIESAYELLIGAALDGHYDIVRLVISHAGNTHKLYQPCKALFKPKSEHKHFDFTSLSDDSKNSSRDL